MDLQPIPIAIGVVLASHGFRKGSLSLSGALAAFAVGSTMLSVQLRTFGISLITFYLLGSRATKYGKHLKAKLEDAHTEGGSRTAWQVFSNSFSAYAAAIIWSLLFEPSSGSKALLPSRLESFQKTYNDAWCPASKASSQWSRALILAALGHFASCLGDTLSSELGILSRTPPRLITNFRQVPPGTNGGITLVGTTASIVGGLLMGAVVASGLVFENSACRNIAPALFVDLLVRGAVAGLGGSLLDSIMGATLQTSRYSKTRQVVLQDETIETDVEVISGLPILSNNQVNVVSSAIVAFIASYW